MATTLPVRLGAHEECCLAFERLLTGRIGAPLLQGLVRWLWALLEALADDESVPRTLAVEVTTSPSLLEVRIPRGRVVDALIFAL